ncbi:MAG: type II toxin-antitoxin system death-on-curing family toxin [Selenomonadaceae bacterium]|nr:type II toxin-antitoxin system death-on-curing family toxin [Selenomonadaceae bacterium]MEE1363096.1 type II toxin-antitoxin system death-on-curing family toxin [Selenomonadaceae bacterium]
MITFLLEDIIDFHNDLEQNSIVSAGIRDKSLIESAVNAPFQTFDNMELYPTVEEKAAHLFYGLVKNHGFIDGNKRVAVHAMFIYLSLNYIFFDYTVDEMEKLVIGLADGSLNADDVVEWIYNKEIDNRE